MNFGILKYVVLSRNEELFSILAPTRRRERRRGGLRRGAGDAARARGGAAPAAAPAAAAAQRRRGEHHAGLARLRHAAPVRPPLYGDFHVLLFLCRNKICLRQ